MAMGNSPVKTEVALQSDGFLSGFVMKMNEGAEVVVAQPMQPARSRLA
jgi:hypothetical protein